MHRSKCHLSCFLILDETMISSLNHKIHKRKKWKPKFTLHLTHKKNCITKHTIKKCKYSIFGRKYLQIIQKMQHFFMGDQFSHLLGCSHLIEEHLARVLVTLALIQSPTNAHPMAQQVKAQGFGCQPPTWEMELSSRIPTPIWLRRCY